MVRSPLPSPTLSEEAAREVTLLLRELQAGGIDAVDRLTPLVYGELRRLAARYMRDERSDHTLQPTALVHEAYLRLVDQRSVEWQGRAHFLSLAARMMRRILVDHARKRATVRHGGNAVQVTLTELPGGDELSTLDLFALDRALGELADIDERAAGVVELRFFGGLTNAEVAEVQGTSPATVKRDWEFARAWLRSALEEGP